jgi:DNA/RNA endonuclease G (NUC1)
MPPRKSWLFSLTMERGASKKQLVFQLDDGERCLQETFGVKGIIVTNELVRERGTITEYPVPCSILEAGTPIHAHSAYTHKRVRTTTIAQTY